MPATAHRRADLLTESELVLAINQLDYAVDVLRGYAADIARIPFEDTDASPLTAEQVIRIIAAKLNGLHDAVWAIDNQQQESQPA